MEARSATTINAPPDTVYSAWRDTGATDAWEAEVTEDVANERIAWHSVEGASVESSGHVELVPAPGDRGTEVHVTIDYDPPGGAVGSAAAKLFGEEPSQHLEDVLRRFKQLTETGEIARSDGAPLGTRVANIA